MNTHAPLANAGVHVEYVWLGSFRFLLAFLVFSAHTAGVWDIFHGSISPGALGVFLFFVVSGYIIASALETFYAGRYWSFLANRAIRLYPSFWACYFLSLSFMYAYGVTQLGGEGVVADIKMTGLGLKSFLLALTIIGGYFDSAALSPNGPTWSIITELFFYVTAMGAPLLLGRYLGQARALWLAGAAALVGAVLVWLTDGSARFYGALSFAPFFVAGAAHWYIRHGRSHPAAWTLLLAALAGCAVFILSADSYHLGSLSLGKTERINQLVVFAALYVLFSCCIVVNLNSPILIRLDRFVGDLTYPFYLCHVPVIALLWHADSGVRGSTHFIATFVICGAVAYFIRQTAETPFIKLRSALRGRTLTTK